MREQRESHPRCPLCILLWPDLCSPPLVAPPGRQWPSTTDPFHLALASITKAPSSSMLHLEPPWSTIQQTLQKFISKSDQDRGGRKWSHIYGILDENEKRCQCRMISMVTKVTPQWYSNWCDRDGGGRGEVKGRHFRRGICLHDNGGKGEHFLQSDNKERQLWSREELRNCVYFIFVFQTFNMNLKLCIGWIWIGI